MLYPRRCPICKEILLPRDGLICPICEKNLPLIEEPKCKKCGKKITNVEQEYCFDCTCNHHTFQQGVALVTYNESIQKSLADVKYHNIRQNLDYYCEKLAKMYGNKIASWKPDVFLAVPLHPSRKRIRGFNQAEEIAMRLSSHLNIPYDFRVLKRVKKTLPQKELNNKQRKKNMEGAFGVFLEGTQYETVILVDDIYTTGCTMQACTDALKLAGVKNVYFITIAIGTNVS